MSIHSGLRLLHLACISQPAHERRLYRAIYRGKLRRILELGVGPANRAQRMIAVASMNWPVEEITYAGLDPFEGRSIADGPGLSLKLAHRMLSSTGAKVRLVPGDPSEALARVANSLQDSDLVVLSSLISPEQLQKVWFWMPRLLHPGSRVFKEQRAAPDLRVLTEMPLTEIQALAGAARQRAA